MEWFETLSNMVLARTSRELVGAIFIATAIALLLSTVYRLTKKKVADTSMVVVGVALFANVVGMLIGGCFIHASRQPSAQDFQTMREKSDSALRQAGHPGDRPPHGPPSGFAFGPSAGFHIVFAADMNRDGRLTSAELEEFIDAVDSEDRGSVDMGEIDKFVMGRFKQSGGPPAIAAWSPPKPPWGHGAPEGRWKRRSGRGSRGRTESKPETSDDSPTTDVADEPTQ